MPTQRPLGACPVPTYDALSTRPISIECVFACIKLLGQEVQGNIDILNIHTRHVPKGYTEKYWHQAQQTIIRKMPCKGGGTYHA